MGIRTQRRDVIGEERNIGEERKVTIARWHNATDLEVERFKTRGGLLKEGSCRRKDQVFQRRPVANLSTERSYADMCKGGLGASAPLCTGFMQDGSVRTSIYTNEENAPSQYASSNSLLHSTSTTLQRPPFSTRSCPPAETHPS